MGVHLSLAPISPSEVRLVSARNVGLFPGIVVLIAVFSTDHFRPCVGPWHISQGRGPRRREHALIFDRHVQLQELASVLAEGIAVEQPILPYVPLDRVFHVIVFAQPIGRAHTLEQVAPAKAKTLFGVGLDANQLIAASSSWGTPLPVA
jgi:hypothetical protein